MKKLFLLVLLTLIIGSFAFETSAQCAMCRASVEANLNDGNTVGSGINTGILYLMAVPYLIFVTVGFFWYKSTPAGKEKLERFSAALRRKLVKA